MGSLITAMIASAGSLSVIDIKGEMVLWTWVTFFIVLILLYKVAWKPILSMLDKREQFLRDSVQTAEKVQQEMDDMAATRRRHEARMEEELKDSIARSRKAAAEAARAIEHKAKEEAQILYENAQREIRAAEGKATAELRRQSAETAVALAARILDQELDEARNRLLNDKLLKEV